MPTVVAGLTLASASISVFTTSRCPLKLATCNGLQPSCNTNVIITEAQQVEVMWCNILYDRCYIVVWEVVKCTRYYIDNDSCTVCL